MTAKEFYRNYQADNIIDDLDRELVGQVISFNPESVFEFGSGSGKNLKLIKEYSPEIETWALDISIINVFQSHINGADCSIRGDERHIPERKFDVVFTCSVLDHIGDIHNIIGAFQEIATKAIILAETNSELGEFYYQHDYESYGFKKLDYFFISENDGGVYHIWVKTLPVEYPLSNESD